MSSAPSVTPMAVVVDAAGPAQIEEAGRGLLAREAPRGTLLEVRLDLFTAVPEPEVAGRLPFPVIATCRRLQDGGRWQGPEEERRKLLKRAFLSGAAYVDIEEDALGGVEGIPRDRILASIHDFHGTPADLDARVARCLRQAAFMKVAVRIGAFTDLLLLRRLATAVHPGRIVAVGLGRGGEIARLLPGAMGSAWTYVRWPCEAGKDRVGAAGLPDYDDMIGLYYGGALLRPPAAVFAVLTDLVGVSIGPLVWNRVFRDAGVPAIYVPLAGSGLTGLREAIRAFGIRGLSVTTPHKESVLPFADELDPRVLEIAAANTLVAGEGGLRAKNTDYAGVAGPVRAAFPEGIPAGAFALVVGSGGAGRAAALALRDLGFDTGLWGRNPANAREAARQVRVRFVESPAEAPAMLVNATPCGSLRAPDSMPVGESLLRPGQTVLEMNYGRETPLARAARLAGGTVIPGEAMYAAQAAEQLRMFWTGIRNPEAALKEAMAWALGRTASS